MTEPNDLATTVVVPSYRRADQLELCLAALEAQSVTPEAIVVVLREDDVGSREVLRDRTSEIVTEILVERPGQIAAMCAGVAVVRTPIVAFTDDDAVPRPEWTERLVRPFQDPSVGGVGGRDVLHGVKEVTDTLTSDVGRLTWWGAHIGNHHRGSGPPRSVHILKGVNCAYRIEALALPLRLRGDGAQVHNEIATGLWARSRHWRLVYDPEIVVDHHPGPRFDDDGRKHRSDIAIANEAYNFVFSVGSFGLLKGLVSAVYSVVLGTRAAPGATRLLTDKIVRRRPVTTRNVATSVRGTAEAVWDLVRGRRMPFYRPPAATEPPSPRGHG